MAPRLSIGDMTGEARLAVGTLAGRAADLVSPTMRLGVTGLAHAGKTVFITALVHNLVHGGRLPLFRPYAAGRVASAALRPQPDDAVPRFAYEDHVRALVEDRVWPESTSRISQLRLTIRYESARYLSRRFGRGELNLDIVDYPGEWLLDLALIGKDYAAWSGEAVSFARAASRQALAAPFLDLVAGTNPDAPEDETAARHLAAVFTDYLKAVRRDPASIALLPPGRFILPGDLAGSPALTFAPLDLTGPIAAGSLAAMMERRYESYKSAVVKPFFRDHFARLDRQIVLVDALHALNAGPVAIAELETALADILGAFRPGRGSWLSSLLLRRIDRILFAVTKADHLHHQDHGRLEAIMARLVQRATERARFAGAEVDVLALAAVRATREGQVIRGGERLPSIIGTPMEGETVNGEPFDGRTEIALFPGDLPQSPDAIFAAPAGELPRASDPAVRFVRFRPPPLERGAAGVTLSLPHIRLDRVLQFLLGDRLA